MKFQKTFYKNGKPIILTFRSLQPGDAKRAMYWINSFVDEKAYLGIQKMVTLREEKKWLSGTLSEIKKNNVVVLQALHKNSFVGSCEIRKRKLSSDSHTADIGISVSRNFRCIGLGKFLMRWVMKEAKSKWKIKIVTLKVFGKNEPAITLYKKLGFKIAGEIPQGFKHYSKYETQVIMYKKL